MLGKIKMSMEASHDQNFMCKTLKICCKICVFCCSKHPIPICILILFFFTYLFYPWVFTFLIYSFPLVGFSFVIHKVLLHIDRQKIKRVEQDDRRKKFAKSRRSFKSIYGDRNQLIRRHVKEKSDGDIVTNFEENDAIFSKSLNDLLLEKRPKDLHELIGESIVGRGESSSSNYLKSLRPHVNDNVNVKDELEGESNWDVSEDEDDEPQDKAVRWTEEDQKNVMDLGISEAERNKRLESLIVRRRSRKNLGFQEEGSTGNKNIVQISAIKIAKTNPFLEEKSCGRKSPGSAPSSLLTMPNPFDLPYDPHEEKPDLTGDNFHEEFTAGHPKELRFSRHESFSLGAFSHPEITNDKHEISFYKDLATNQNFVEHGTSTVDNKGDCKHTQQDSPFSDDRTNDNHSKEGESSEQLVGILHEEDGSARETKELDAHDLNASNEEGSDFQGNADSYDERKADIVFFYGSNNKHVRHGASNSIVSDLQVEVSDEGSAPTLDDLDIEKDKESWLNSTNPSEGDVEAVKKDGEKDNITNELSDIKMDGTVSNQEIIERPRVSETENNPQSSNSDMMQRNHIQASNSSVVPQTALPDGLTEVAVAQAPVTLSSPKSVLQREYSTDPASPYNFANEVQQSDNQIREAYSSDSNGLHQTNSSGENPFSNRNLENLQDQNDRKL